ncbi:hypothetical protein Taro_015923, partial [Colocasia esculenta]|nr:hypothetical protein [Colocasia esculenta]
NLDRLLSVNGVGARLLPSRRSTAAVDLGRGPQALSLSKENEVEEVDPEQPEIQLGDSDEEEYISDQNESDNEDVNAEFDISPTSEDEMENMKIWFEDGVGLLQPERPLSTDTNRPESHTSGQECLSTAPVTSLVFRSFWIVCVVVVVAVVRPVWCRFGPEMKQDLLQFSWSWRPGVAVDLLASSALVVGGTDTSSRHWSPASPFPVPHSSEPRPGSPEVSGMGLRPCGPQVVLFFVVGRRHWPVRGRQTRIKYVIGLTGLAEAFRHSWYQSKKFKMADRRDWGGAGDDPEESTQRMIERIWESLTDIRARMDQQAPVPPVAVPPGDGEVVPVAPVPPGVEVPFVAPVPPPPPVLLAEELVMQVEKFLRLQPPTYSGGPNPDTAEHWVHEIERVFATMRCPAADKVVLAAYQLRGFALEWWRLKMQTTFSGRTEEAITWTKFLDVIGSPEGRFSTLFSFSLAPASRPRIPKASNRLRRVVGGMWNVWRCRIGRGNTVAWCNCRRSSRRVWCEPGEFGRFKHVLSRQTVSTFIAIITRLAVL